MKDNAGPPQAKGRREGPLSCKNVYRVGLNSRRKRTAPPGKNSISGECSEYTETGATFLRRPRNHVYLSQEQPSRPSPPANTVCRHPGIAQDARPSLIQANKSHVTVRWPGLKNTTSSGGSPPLSDKRTAVSFPTDKALAIYPVIMHFVREWDSTVTDILFPGTASSAPLHAATTAYGKSRKHRGSTTLKPCLHSASCDMLCRLFPGQIWTSWNNPA